MNGPASSTPATVTLTVYSVPVANPDSYGAVAGNVLTVNAAAGVLANDTDADGGTLTAVLGTNVSHGTLTLNSNGSFSYTPTAGYSGTDSFTYIATDGHATSSPATVTLTVYSVPVANPDAYTVVAGNTLTINAAGGVLANDTDADGGTLSAVLDTNVSHGSLTLNADGSFSYTPAAGYSGTDSFTYTATDGHATSASAKVIFLVYSVPVANPVNYGTFEEQTLQVSAENGVLATDSDADGLPLSAQLFGPGPSNGQLTLDSDGSFSYTPNPGFSGTDTFYYTATDGYATSAPALVTITVAATAPVITSFSPTAGITGTVVTINGSYFTGATEVDLDGTPEPFTVVNDTTITFTVTDDADTGQITVTTPAGSTTSNDFFLDYQVPIIIWFAPNIGGPGTVVTISGIYFSGSTVVTFGGVPATSITVVNDSTIYATVGNGASGAITVTNPAHSDPVDTFTFIPAPTITSFTRPAGETGLSSPLPAPTLPGTTAVSFGGTTAASFTVANDDTIEATVGNCATGQIMVVTPGGTAISADLFTYLLMPIINSFTPTAGITGTVVTITGANFTDTTEVDSRHAGAVHRARR